VQRKFETEEFETEEDGVIIVAGLVNPE